MTIGVTVSDNIGDRVEKRFRFILRKADFDLDIESILEGRAEEHAREMLVELNPIAAIRVQEYLKPFLWDHYHDIAMRNTSFDEPSNVDVPVTVDVIYNPEQEAYPVTYKIESEVPPSREYFDGRFIETCRPDFKKADQISPPEIELTTLNNPLGLKYDFVIRYEPGFDIRHMAEQQAEQFMELLDGSVFGGDLPKEALERLDTRFRTELSTFIADVMTTLAREEDHFRLPARISLYYNSDGDMPLMAVYGYEEPENKEWSLTELPLGAPARHDEH